MELLQEVLEGGLGHLECLQPLLVVPGGLDDMQPPVLASQVGPEVVKLEAQEGVDGLSSGVHGHIIGICAGVQAAGQGPGGSCVVVCVEQRPAGTGPTHTASAALDKHVIMMPDNWFLKQLLYSQPNNGHSSRVLTFALRYGRGELALTQGWSAFDCRDHDVVEFCW
ncbi:hypothetical protein Y1Q_0001035 [Alligator mississippiensis]|uniref:Uncharacterized protein n=1 Tax=Alligator mississippiensis TaxID=8496 RepID=A0A151NER7_ALLMI|nr:hypothetical protein Y1Q_0001035 [Alligator mississippiensis]